MIRALIVDDEMLVRKGLIQTLPWEKYGIRIAGEADSAIGALEFLQNNSIDLLLTDITMPNMSGFDLMREVQKTYPEIHIVVITCHQDFDFIQKALRMGAIDYLVKTRIDDAELEDSLRRITGRMLQPDRDKTQLPQLSGQRCIEDEVGCILIPRKYAQEGSKAEVFEALQNAEKIDLPGDCTLYFLSREKAQELCGKIESQGTDGRWILVMVENVYRLGRDKLNGFVSDYIRRELFYGFDGKRWCFRTDAAVESYININYNDESSRLKKIWGSILWISENEEFQRLKTETRTAGMDIFTLKSVFYKSAVEWEAFFCLTLPEDFYGRLELSKFWIDYIAWLEEVRGYILQKLNRPAYPEEIVTAVLNSIEYIKLNLSKELSQDYIAKMCNLSRGYFSRVFKEIVGINFVDYMKGLRIGQAKLMLVQTNLPVYRIAEEVGFLDEKYFSRLFKESTGLTPVEFRGKTGR